jgi:hypothetical protein
MKKLILAAVRCSLMFEALAALSVVCPVLVQAVPTTYKYTGNPFTTAIGRYTTSDFVTVTVTLASPLAPNMPFTRVTPMSFSLSDGVQTITDHNAVSFKMIVATGPTGLITHWKVGGSKAPDFEITTVALFQDEPTRDDGIYGVPNHGANLRQPGAWRPGNSAATAGVPMPGLPLSCCLCP